MSPAGAQGQPRPLRFEHPTIDDVPPSLAAPRLRFQHLTHEDGLSLNLVRAMLQDRRGFMWFGTEDGLNRYDGYRFIVYEAVPFDATSLLDDNIYALAEGPSGVLWLGTASGLSRFDPHTGRFHNYAADADSLHGLPPGRVSALVAEPSGVVWVGLFDGGLVRFDPRTGRFRHHRHDPRDPGSLSSNRIQTLYRSADGVLWVATTNGLNRLAPNGTFRRYLYDAAGLGPNEAVPARFSAPRAVLASIVLAVCDDPGERGVRWVGTGAGLVRLDTRTGEAQRFTPDPARPYGNVISAVLPDPRTPGVLWVASREGLYHFAVRAGRFTRYRHDPDDPSSISGEFLRGLLSDHAGLVWVQTNVEGIERFDPAGTAFVHERFSPAGGPATGTSVSVTSLAEDLEGRSWFTSGGSLARLDRTTGRYTRYRDDPSAPSDFADDVNKLYVDRDGALWMGRAGGKVDRLDPVGAGAATGRLTRFARAEGQPPAGVFTFYEDRAGVLWAGGGAGLSRLEADGQAFERVPLGSTSRQEGTEPFVFALLEDTAGAFWVGTGAGLLRLDRATGAVTTYGHVRSDPASLSTDVVYAIHERAREPGVLWLGTTGGLDRFETQTGQASHFTVSDGLPSGTIWAILEDERGHLWLSTNNGLSSFDPERRAFTNYGTDVGVQSREFNLGAAYRSPRTGELFFGGINGFNTFFPDRVEARNPHPPAVVLTGLRIANHPVTVSAEGPLRQPIEEAEEVRLQPSDRTVTFEYVGLHFQDPERNRYAYRLDGFDTDWVDAGAERAATYTNLDPGTYTFRVKAANSDGVWNEEGASIRLVVVPPWWRHDWFYALCVLGALALVAAGYRWRVHQLTARARALEAEVDVRTRELVAEKEKTEAQARRLAELDEAKSRFFANVSHEFRTPLTLLLSPLDEALGGTYGPLPDPMQRQARVMRRNARRLLRLVNQLLDLSKLEAGKFDLDRRPGDLVPFLRALLRSFTPLAERRRIALQFQSDTETLPLVFDRDAVEKVVSNLVSNALKFTPEGGRVWVTVSADGEVAEVVVKDTGPGIPPEALERIFDRFHQVDGSATRPHEGTGLGLALARELVELHGGTLRVESAPGFGSAFVVRLPLDVPDGAPAAKDAPAGDGAAALEHAALVAEAEEHAGASLPASDAAGPDDNRPAVLVVEDHPDVRALLRDALSVDYRVLEAADGEEGWEAVRAHRPALVVSDVMMPGLDGFALCRRIKADEALRTTPVILLTARAAEADRIRGLEGGADDYVAKPFSTRELLVRATNLILSQRRLRERFRREVVVAPAGVVIESEDEALLARVLEVLERHLGDSTFSVEALADALGLSRRQCYRRVKAVTGEPPAELLRRLRLERAAALLAAHPGTVAEVAYAVGFRSPSHFAAAFRKAYGAVPSDYAAGAG